MVQGDTLVPAAGTLVGTGEAPLQADTEAGTPPEVVQLPLISGIILRSKTHAGYKYYLKIEEKNCNTIPSHKEK